LHKLQQLSQSIIIGTRGSRLALWQAEHLMDKLTAMGHIAELKIIKTQGDLIQNLSFDKLEGKGFFTKELEDALLNKEVDVAVHSMKDMLTTQPEGLVIAAVSERADPADLLILNKNASDEGQAVNLSEGMVVGTSSSRRKSQIKKFYPGIEVKDLRGNVPTRVKKLADGQYDAIILAKAGLDRLNLDLSTFNLVRFNPKEFIPAPAQGVMAYQTHAENTALRNIFKEIHHEQTGLCTNVERTVLKMMDGGCQMPLGVYCELDQLGNYHVFASYGLEENIVLAQASLSTHIGLAQNIFNQLSSN